MSSPFSTLPPEFSRTLRLLAICSFGSSVSMRVCDPMLPRLSEEFGGVATDMAPVVTAFAVAYGLFSLLHGPLGDRRGKVLVITWATLVASIASLACMIAWSQHALVAFRFVAGAACAGIIPLSLAWIGDNVDYEIRQPVLGRFAAAYTGGVVAGQVAGGLFTDTLGWRAAFMLPLVLFLIAGSMLLLREQGKPAVARPAAVGAGYRSLLRSAWVRFILVAVGIEGALAFGAMAFVPSYLHASFGMPLWRAGLVTAGFGVGGLAFAYLVPRLFARLGATGLAIAGAAAMATGLSLIATAPGWPLVAAGAVITGIGFSGLHNTLQTQATQMHPQARGAGIAVFAMCLFVGQSIGVALTAELIPLSGYRPAFAGLALGLLALGIVVRRQVRLRYPEG
ncbi:MAG: MFS transporter [Burkholderiales bacterium]|nr:MAG: MFS transporter [Burkholderiales bacterium]